MGITFLFVLAMNSCKDKPQKPILTDSQIFQASLNEEDTLQMLRLTDECMEFLKNKNIDGALAMLYEYDDSTHQVSPLSDETRIRYERLFSMFPVLSYQRQFFKFMSEGLNDVKYEVIFAEESHPEKNGVPKTSFMFNPVKVDSVWYITVKRPDQEITH